MKNLELKIVEGCQKIGWGKIDPLMILISDVKFLAGLWLVLVGIFWLAFGADRMVLLERVLVVAVLHFGISEGLIKHLSSRWWGIRRRPFVAHPQKIKPLGHQFSDGSFPSSHMASTLAMLVVLFSIWPAIFWPGLVFVFLMSFARLHNGMHYPSDVISGILLGLAYGAIAIILI